MRVSEYVSLGHPDKVCDYISSRILDGFIVQDKNVKYALEVMAKDNSIFLAGEISGNVSLGCIRGVVKNAIEEIGYTGEYAKKWSGLCIDPDRLQIVTKISQQSPDIAVGVSNGWGDQGIFTGMAYNNVFSDYFYPDYFAAKTLCNQLFKSKLGGLDIKTQVYMSEDFKKIKEIVVAIPLKGGKDKVVEFIRDNVSGDYNLVVNGTGVYTTHSTVGDCGITGRKLVVDFYGGGCEIGGGSPWTKDGSKADLALNMYARKLALDYMREHALSFVKCKIACCIGLDKVVVSFYNEKNELLEEGTMHLNPHRVKVELGLYSPIYGELCRDGIFSKIK